MRIAEISTQELRQPSEDPPSPLRHQQLLSQIESLIKQAENHPPDKTIPESISSDLRQTLTHLTQLSFPAADNSLKLHLWKLSYRLWNACVDLSNAACIQSPPSNSAATSIAKLRHVASDMLSLAVDVSGVPSPAIKCASFYHKTGVIWHDLRNFDLASTCFERATDLVAKLDIGKISDAGERKLLLELNIARSRTAWEVSDRNLSITLLYRSKSLLQGSSSHYRALANQYLVFSKSVLARNDIHAFAEALKLMNEALDLCEKGLTAARTREETVEIRELRVKTLRFISAAHLQKGEYESVIKCVNVLRESGEGGDNHASLPVLAMKAWLGLRRFSEAEKELRDMAANKGVPEAVWVSAVEAYFQAAGTAGAETAKSVFLGLLERCHVSARSAVRVAHKVLGDGAGVDGSRVRAKVVAELVADDRVVALFSYKAAEKERVAMHGVLWNCASDHFQSKDYETSAALFEKSMLYMSDGVDKRVQRAKGFRVLCLCNLALSQLDQAQEYINEAEKLEPNMACAFLKFKIYLQKNELDGAIGQIQAMKACLDFTPEFLSLSAHEAMSCQALPVAVASLSNFLNYYSSGKAMATSEVVVLRTLITILTQDHGNEIEVLKYLKQGQVRLSQLGAENFFGKEEVGKREWNWFAATSWNFGTKSGKEKRYELCAEFFKLAAEFYGVKLDTEMKKNNITMCRSLVLAVSAMIASENQKKTPLTDTEVKLAVEMLDKAGKIITSASTGMGSSGDELGLLEPDILFMYTFTALDIQGRLNNAESQLLLVRNFVSSKSCNPKYLLQIGLCVSQGPRFNPQVATLAMKEGLAAALSFPIPVYPDVAVIIRRLIAISSIHIGDTDVDAVLHMYKQAYRIMVGLKDGEYPTEEGKWLAMTAWNRAALPLKLGQIEAANKWMKTGLELATMVAGMETYKACMEDYISGIEKSLGVGVKIAGEGKSEQQAPVLHL